MTRDPDLQALLDALGADCARALPAAGQDGHRVCTEVLARAGVRPGRPGPGPAAAAAGLLPACAHLSQALATAASGPFSATAVALARLAPRLSWTRRSSATPGTAFFDGHANAMLLGPGGLEQRDDLWIGLSLIAPGVLYPDHDHGPEETYLPLGPGQWFNTQMGWQNPQGRGLVYNPPGITHAMRAEPDAALLALWLLPP